MADTKRALKPPPSTPNTYRRETVVFTGDNRLALGGLFSCEDASEIETLMRRPLRIQADELAESLNALRAEYFARRERRTDSTYKMRAEWCGTISVKAAQLMAVLADLDGREQPSRCASINANNIILEARAEPLTVRDVMWLPNGLLPSSRSDSPLADTMEITLLNRVPAMLWALAQITGRAAKGYEQRGDDAKRAEDLPRARSRSSNRGAPERVFLLGAAAHVYQRASGKPPPSAPTKTGTYTLFVDFICRRISGSPTASSDSDRAGMADLRKFGPGQIAHQWRNVVGTEAADPSWQWAPRSRRRRRK